jgi:hypothetical protein
MTKTEALNAARIALIPSARRNLAQRHTSKLGDCVAWTWTSEQGKPCAVAYIGASAKPVLFASFKTEASRREYVARAFAAAASRANRKAAADAEKAQNRAQPIGLAVGDVLRSSWGYDQTNIDYYQVTKLVGTQSVEVRKIAGQIEPGQQWATGKSVPAPDAFIGPAKVYRVSLYGKRDSIKIASYAQASRMDYAEVQGIRVYGASEWTAYA